MDMQGALRDRLADDPAVAAVITADGKTRAYWTTRPQSTPLPAVVMQVVSDPRPQHLSGFHELRETRVQIKCLATTYEAMRNLTEKVIAALVPENTSNGIIFNRAMVDSVQDLGEQTGTQFIHYSRVDLLVWWQTE